jgi:hypothetical protein
MDLFIKITLAVVCGLLLLNLLKRVLMLLFLRVLMRAGLTAVGRQAMAEQPDEIHLTPEPEHVWADADAVEEIASPLASLGFQEAGTFAIEEMAGVMVRFLIQPDQRVIACIYEHPQAGTWFDLVARYQDGRSLTYTTAPPTGLDKQPGTQTVNAPGTSADELYRRLLCECPVGDREEITAATVVHRFQDAYARETAWRKNKGVSADEVARNIELSPAEA